MAAAVTSEADILSRVSRSVKRSRDMFLADYGSAVAEDVFSQRLKLTAKILEEYAHVRELPPALRAARPSTASASASSADASLSGLIDQLPVSQKAAAGGPSASAGAMVLAAGVGSQALSTIGAGSAASQALMRNPHAHKVPKPKWHAPWKLMRVISGHLGWVRCIAVDPTNEWFATGSADRMIKVWDLASGTLKVSLTGHINTIRGIAISDRHPYLYSVGEDKMAKCWDLEVNKVIRSYHGHLNGIYTCALHPTLDVFITAGRDATVRVWDIRSKQSIHVLTGHKNTIASVATQGAEPQIISGSMDQTVRLWDLAAGKCRTVLTNHKKSVRSVLIHPTEYTFATASPDNIKQWKCPDGDFLQNLSGHNSIVNTLAINQDDVMFSGADNGTMHFWDWKSGYNFQQAQTKPQPGSLESEAGIYASTFDKSGARLLTCEADKTIKVWKEDEFATEETHPISFKASLKRARY